MQHHRLAWEQPGWFDQVSAWIEAQLAALQIAATGPAELVHQRPWSALAQVPTTIGMLYFKAPAPAYPHEAPLTEALARWRPDCTAPLLAVDFERGWMLSADAGITFRAADPSATQLAHWRTMMPRYASLQIDMIGRVPEIVAFQTPDRRLAHFPELFNHLLDDSKAMMIGQEGGLTPDQYQRLLDLRPQVAAWCAQLAAYSLPETLTHEEVHDANVLVHGDRYTFIDWSDSCVGHPFFTMLVSARVIAYRLNLDEHGPEVASVRDAYLEPWTAFAPRAQLAEAMDIAYRLAMINRSLSWRQGLSILSDEDRAKYADSVPGWLQDFLDAVGEA